MFRHLRTKLTVLYAGLFAATLLLIALAALEAVSQSARQTVHSDLAASGAVFERVRAQRLTEFQNDGVLISHDFGFRTAVATRDVPTIRSSLQNLKGRLGIDAAFLTMPDGVTIAADEKGPPLDARTRQALQGGDEAVSGVLLLGGQPYQAAAIPVGEASQGGWLVFATRLDTQEMRSLEAVAAIPLTASIVYRDGAGPWRQNRADSGLGARPDPQLMQRLSAGGASQLTISTPGGQAIALARPLKPLTGGQQIELVAEYPLAQAMAPYRRLLALLLVTGAVGLVLLVIGSWALARTVTRPISQLEGAARRLQGGGEAASVEVKSRDEIGRLANSFNSMANEVRQRERELAGALEAAEAANRAKSTFLTNMSHEVRTPLNGVIGIAGVLGAMPLADEQRKLVEVIQNSAGVLQRVLDDVLDLARIEAGRMEIASEPFDLGALVAAVAAHARALCEAKGLAFSLQADTAAQGWAQGDAMRLQQVLGNLLGNAVKFTRHGEVSLRVQRTSPAAVRFQVRDTGIGFDPAIAADLFRPFQQADGSITRQYGGSGLGLSISRDLARAMGGDIVATAAPGEGATFTVDAPIRTIDPPAATPSQAAGENLAAEPAARDLRILIADDHPTNRQVVQLILESVGVEVVAAQDGQEAVAAYEAGGIDLILMDMQMPVMDGVTAVAEIRRRERARRLPRLPIVMLSANAMPEHVSAALAAGADSHVAKPITPTRLIAAIERALQGDRPSAAAAGAA